MTDTKTAQGATSDKPPETKPKRLDLSATQLAGGALAAMTSAVIGSQLGVAGTVLGAAIASIVAGVAGTLYTTSLRHTRDKIASAVVGRVGDTRVEITQVSGASSPTPTAGVPEDTLETPVWDTAWDTAGWDTTDTAAFKPTTVGQPAASAPASADPVARTAEINTGGPTRSGLPWKPILLSAAAVFVLAFAGITGYELVSGHSLSGGDGTTITQVSEGRTGPQTPADSTETPTAPTASPSTSAEPSATAAPSTSESVEPTTTPEPTPSVEPSTSQSAEPQASTPAAQPSQAPGGTEPSVQASGNAGGIGGTGG